METEKIVFLPFDAYDRTATAILLLKELEMYTQKINLEVRFSSISELENGGIFFSLEKGYKKAEIHFDKASNEMYILIILFSQNIHVKYSPYITTADEMSFYLRTLINFLNN